MRVAVSSKGPDAGSPVDERFGRAGWFVIVDTSTGQTKAIDNSEGAGASSGAGVRSVQAVVDQGAECVLTGQCGPKALRALHTAGVKVFTDVDGTVQDAIERLKAGHLEPVPEPEA